MSIDVKTLFDALCFLVLPVSFSISEESYEEKSLLISLHGSFGFYANDCYSGSLGRWGGKGQSVLPLEHFYRFGLYSYLFLGRKILPKVILLFSALPFLRFVFGGFFIIQFFPFLLFLLSISWGLFPRLENRFLLLGLNR